MCIRDRSNARSSIDAVLPVWPFWNNSTARPSPTSTVVVIRIANRWFCKSCRTNFNATKPRTKNSRKWPKFWIELAVILSEGKVKVLSTTKLPMISTARIALVRKAMELGRFNRRVVDNVGSCSSRRPYTRPLMLTRRLSGYFRAHCKFRIYNSSVRLKSEPMHQINAAQYTVSGDKQIMAKLCHKYFSDV